MGFALALCVRTSSSMNILTLVGQRCMSSIPQGSKVRYSPECVEVEFCELRLSEILGSPCTRCAIEPGIYPKVSLPRPSQTMGDATGGSPIPLQAAIKAHSLCEENAPLQHRQRLSERYSALQFHGAGLAYIPPLQGGPAFLLPASGCCATTSGVMGHTELRLYGVLGSSRP